MGRLHHMNSHFWSISLLIWIHCGDENSVYPDQLTSDEACLLLFKVINFDIMYTNKLF